MVWVGTYASTEQQHPSPDAGGQTLSASSHCLRCAAGDPKSDGDQRPAACGPPPPAQGAPATMHSCLAGDGDVRSAARPGAVRPVGVGAMRHAT